MKKLGIGYEFYKKIIEDDCYYVDKTLLIRDVLKKGSTVTLFTRPRRFGKTLALTMLKTFFELEYDYSGNVVDKLPYFEGKKIMNESPEILEKMGKYPVIFMSLKSARQPDFRTAFLNLRYEIAEQVRRHLYVLDSEKLSENEKVGIRELAREIPDSDIKTDAELKQEVGRFSIAFKKLSNALEKYHGRKTIILLDEYDVPLENAYYAGFYDEMVAFIRSLFESSLKTNDSLEFAVVTGCLRISKESIFTGLNNLTICSIRDSRFGEYFGFTVAETQQFLRDYGLEEKIDEARQWYDGYLFGKSEVYNPWSVTSYVIDMTIGGKQFPEPYWSNTSSNQIIKDMIYHADEEARDEIKNLIDGGTIEKQIHEDITYNDIHESPDNLWNFLFFTGYMRKVSERQEGIKVYVTMRIPNNEILYIYDEHITNLFEDEVRKGDHTAFRQAVLDGNVDYMGDYVSTLLEKSISTFDSQESFYHGFFLSLLYGVPGYSVQSNREEGIGRPDIVLYPNRPKDKAIIFEVKVRKKFNEMQDGIEEAFKQIKDEKYEEGVLDDGYIGSIAYGICFCKKTCIIQRYDKI